MMNGCRRWWFLTVPLLAALGCSDPVPRPAQGNLTLSITRAAGNTSCPVPGQTYGIGNPKPPTLIPQSYGDRLIDGDNGSSIKCSVKGSGPFTFSGTIKATTPQSDKVTLTITNGVINADKATGTATIAVSTPQLGGTFTSADGACVINVVNSQVKAGSVWAGATCATVTDPSTTNVCAVAATTNFVLENCEGT